MSEYTNAFKTPLNDPYTTHLERRSDAAVASEQLIKLFLCEFLILFLRNDPSGRQRTVRSIHSSDATLNLLINYMEQNITKTVTLKELMEYSGTNRTAIENIFRENLGKGAVEYFLILKIELAKKYLREDNYNITQISEILGYSSIHYFSRQFKKITGMTPTEYLLSIKAMMDN